MTTKKVHPHELIGRTIEVVSSPNQSVEKTRWKIVDETKATLRVSSPGSPREIRTLLKGSITFQIVGTDLVIQGRDIIRRPEERVKG